MEVENGFIDSSPTIILSQSPTTLIKSIPNQTAINREIQVYSRRNHHQKQDQSQLEQTYHDQEPSLVPNSNENMKGKAELTSVPLPGQLPVLAQISIY